MRANPRKLAGLGVVVVATAVGIAYLATHWAARTNTSDLANGSAVDDGPGLLETAKKLHQRGDLEQAHQAIEKIADHSASLSDPAVETIESAWAETQLQAAAGKSDTQAKIAILFSVRNAPRVDVEKRRRAQRQLRDLGAD